MGIDKNSGVSFTKKAIKARIKRNIKRNKSQGSDNLTKE